MSASLRPFGGRKEIGLDVLTDGELRRRNFMSDLIEAAGFDREKSFARN
jgi:methionine synthase II (cobalamin-independent)